MPTLFLSSFDWERLSEILDQPSVTSARLVRLAKREELPESLGKSGFFQTDAAIDAFIRRLFSAPDWYAGKSPQESRTVDFILMDLFEEASTSKRLRLEPINDGLMMEILEIATGRAEIDQTRITSTSKILFVRKIEPTREDDGSELASLGSRPFRHPSWNRAVAEDLLRRNNPFIAGIDAAYFPDYSIHSPSEVELIRQDLIRVSNRARTALDRMKSKKLRTSAVANFEDDLSIPIQTAATLRRALIARWDY